MTTSAKRCTGPCGLTKDLSEFSPNGKRNGRQYYRSACKDCKNDEQRARYQSDPESRSKTLASNARWARQHPDRKILANRQWEERNLLSLAAKQQRRRARKKAATVVPFTLDELLSSWADDDLYGCAFCGGPFEEIEHVVPICRGGEHSIANLVPSCVDCNRGVGGKGQRDPWEWLAERFPELKALLGDAQRQARQNGRYSPVA